VITKIKRRKAGHEYINPDHIIRIDSHPQRYEITMLDNFTFYADKGDVTITALIDTADTAYTPPA